MNVNLERIKRNLRLISFPRLSGTIYERKAFELILNKIENLNLNPKIQKFKFSTFYSRIYPKLAFPLSFWVLFILFLNFNIFFVIFNIIIPSALFLPFFILTRHPEDIKIGKILESQNIYVKIENKNKDNSDMKDKNSINGIKNLFFLAHVDSKGQRYTARIRFLSIFLFAISLISLTIMYILRGIFLTFAYNIISYICIIPLIINFISILILSTNTTNNKSKGVVDNASGIACLIELMTQFYERKFNLENLNIWFVFTGAEETGTMGIRYFANHLNEVDPSSSIVNNFESLGKSVAIFIGNNIKENNKEFYDRFESVAKKYGFFTYISRITRGVHTDGIYMFRKGFNLFEFGSTEVGKYMHSEKDSIQNVDPEILGSICEALLEILETFQN